MSSGQKRITGYGVGAPKITLNPPPIITTRAPATTDTRYPLGQNWVNTSTGSAYQLTTVSAGSATWVLLGSSSGAVDSVLGTTNQITVTTAGNVATASLPSAITAPGSLTTTTSLAATTTVTAGTGITATTGNITATAGAVSANTTVTAGTTVTATLGNITATNGNLVMGTAGNKIIVPTGANASAGTSAAMTGTPGAVTVATTACSATAKVFYCRATTGGTPGNVSITAQDGTGFTLTSTGNETSTFNWWIINA